MAASDPMEEPGESPSRRIEPVVPDEPARLQSLPAQREPGAAVGLPLRRRHDQLPREVDGSTEMAEVDGVRKDRRRAVEASGWHYELLPDEGSIRSRGSGELESSPTHQSRSRLQEPAIPPVEGQADGCGQHRIRRSSQNQESRVEWTFLRILAESHKFIETRAPASTKFQLNFDVGIVDAGFLEGFFDLISQGVAGTFCGVEPGSKLLNEILGRQEFNTENGIEAFLNEMTDALQRDRRPGGKPVRVADQLRKSKTVLALYDFIFSMTYLKPRYALRMGVKELSELSPGERGTLLLVFYLLVDKDDIPLVIDQPEENLDNQTVYELLVPCMKEAKRRRQLFMVTHNPNLAVVCDAEQVICAELDKKANYRTEYLSGAIENPQINTAIVDVLEGTMPAFRNRDSKYSLTAVRSAP